jgi:hypothetical protein
MKRAALLVLSMVLAAVPVGMLAAAARTKTVADRLAEFGQAARGRLAPFFAQAQVTYPPTALVFVGLKAEKRLEIYAAGRDGKFHFIRDYPILAASGKAGPKLREGDLQVPEGIYGIELLNPNSSYHVSLRVSYPSADDRQRAQAEGRTNLGGDIMIHGNAVSIGCLAMGDPAAEDLFTLAADTGIKAIRVLLAPHDLRVKPAPKLPGAPVWLADRYAQITRELAGLQRERVSSSPRTSDVPLIKLPALTP